MTDEGEFVGGWKTLLDGSRVPMTTAEAEGIQAMMRAAKEKQAKAYPETLDALRAFLDAEQRLTDLGWKKYVFGLEDGAAVAVIERGSTGIFKGVWIKPYFHFCDCVSLKERVLWKRIEDLTDDERQRMNSCSADHAVWMEAQTAIFARMAAEFLND